MASNGEQGATTGGAGDNQQFAESKGKGKAAASDIPQDTPMGEEADDDDDDEEEEEAEEVCLLSHFSYPQPSLEKP